MESTQPPGTPPPQPPEPPSGEGAAPPPAAGPPPAEPAADYPVQLDFVRQPEYRRFMPLIKWLLAIPHYVVLLFLSIGAFFAAVIAFFAVIFTRRYPRGLFDFVVGTFRYAWRVTAYVLLLTDDYPPFSLAEDPAYPVSFTIDYPEEGVDRWRPLFAWLLALPYLLVANILQQLAQLLIFFAFFTILFAKSFPEGMFKIVEVAFRWQARGGAYAYFMTTRYPPFVWG